MKRGNARRNFSNTEEAVEYITDRLIKAGIVVHRYDAMTSCSIYLKFDYGVSNTLRVSDHKGKTHLNYKYNLNTTSRGKEKSMTPDGYARYTYGLDSVCQMVDDIISSRQTTITKYGMGRFNRNLRSAKQRSKEYPVASRGFWRKAYKVSL